MFCFIIRYLVVVAKYIYIFYIILLEKVFLSIGIGIYKYSTVNLLVFVGFVDYLGSFWLKVRGVKGGGRNGTKMFFEGTVTVLL